VRKSTAGPIARNASERERARRRPGPSHVQPDVHEQRHRKRGAGVRERRRHVHVEEQRRAQPDRQAADESAAIAEDHPRRADRQQDRKEGVEGGPVGDRADIRLREAVGGWRARRPRPHVSGRVERRPQNPRAHRRVVHPPPDAGLALEERFVEAVRSRDVVVVEVAVLVLERDVPVEIQRPQIGEILDFVRRIQPRRDCRERDREEQHEDEQFSRRQAEEAYEAIQQGDPECYRSARNLRIWARLNTAWLTTGATMLPRRR
jgi:hypothetical protein